MDGLFREAGYAPLAPGWPGEADTVEETRRQPERVAGKGIDDVVAHYAQIIRGLDAPPITIGHSFGGLMVQRLLGQDLAAAAVAIDPAPIKGVLILPPSELKAASVALRKPANRNLAVALTREQFRYGFGNALPAQESDELYDRWAIPSPGKTLFEAAFANFTPNSPAKVNTQNKTRGPLLVTAGLRTTRFRTSSPPRPAGSTTGHPRSPTSGSSPTAATRSRSTTAGARSPKRCSTG